MVLNFKKFNPNAFYLFRFMNDASLRFIIMFGGSSSSKSYSMAQSILIQTLLDGENTLVMRKVSASIERTIYEDFKVAASGLGIKDFFQFKQNSIRCKLNEAKIDFSGLDDPEKIKGISNYKRVLLEELSEFELVDFKQIRKRLRGKVGQQILADFNPISADHWIKKNLFDNEQWHDIPMEVEMNGKKIPSELTKVKSIKMNAPRSILNPKTKEVEVLPSNMVAIQTTYLNNFWVVGSPDGTYGYYDEQCIADFEYDRLHDPDYYNVYALGEWGILRTGSEFLPSFNIGKNVSELEYDDSLPIHVSVDNNVLPYISVSMWQVDLSNGKTIRQIGNICAIPPNNSVKKAAKLLVKYLFDIGFTDKLYLHGDASSKAANTIDDDKRSFMDLFISTLQANGIEVIDTVGNKNPSVAMTGEFLNQIFEFSIPGIKVEISDKATESIEDYQAVQKDCNGAMSKAKIKDKTLNQTYEKHGHLTDTMRYIVYDICTDEYLEFANKRKRNRYAKDGMLNFFNKDVEFSYDMSVTYVMPSYEENTIIISARHCADKWHITDACVSSLKTQDDIKQYIEEHQSDTVVVECSEAYYSFVRELRNNVPDVRIKKLYTDMDNRISATFDYVRNMILFSSEKLNDDLSYTDFVNNLLDYNRDSDIKSAAATLSGLIQFVIKLQS